MLQFGEFLDFSDMLRKLQSVIQMTKVVSALDLIKENQQPLAFLINFAQHEKFHQTNKLDVFCGHNVELL